MCGFFQPHVRSVFFICILSKPGSLQGGGRGSYILCIRRIKARATKLESMVVDTTIGTLFTINMNEFIVKYIVESEELSF